MGQGTGDAAPRWVVQSHLLITAYHLEASIWQLCNPTMHATVSMGIDAYMDDTNQIIGNDNNNQLALLIPVAQANIDLWQGLIQASGGTLNPEKCSWTPFLWQYDKLGNAQLAQPIDTPQYQITVADRTGKRHTLIRNAPDKAVRLLGVHIVANGNYTTELQVLKDRQANYSTFLQRTPLTRREARVIYRQCYLPKVTYPLLATHIPTDKLYQTQLCVTMRFLNKMGYPAHLPWAVVYAPIEVGSLGFQHLGYKQGVQQVLQLVKHLRSTTLNGKIYRALIDAYQIVAGSARPILEHTDFIPWCPNGWMTTLRQFLH